MEYPFDELHAGIESQILNFPAGIPDSEAVTQARALPDSIEKFLALGKAFSRQLRYREAIDAYTEGLKMEPGNLPLLRLRAGRHLTTLQNNLAITDFEKMSVLGCGKAGLSLSDRFGTLLCRAVCTGNGDFREWYVPLR